MRAFHPTPNPDLNEVLHDLVSGVQANLQENFLGAYLGGSYAHGGWDAYSDVDFNIVIARDLHWTELDPLKAVHAGIFTRGHYGARHLEGAYALDNRWAQAFVVMMYCRMLHSLASGAIQGKPAGAAWGKANLAPRWIPLIDDALSARPNQYEKIWQPADSEKVARTLEFIAYALNEGRITWRMVA